MAGLIGGAALCAGVALTATSGWLIVRASERPVILTLLTAIVAVRTFGLARPVFRYWERLLSHDTALDDLARRRTDTYAHLVPLTPARLGGAAGVTSWAASWTTSPTWSTRRCGWPCRSSRRPSPECSRRS